MVQIGSHCEGFLGYPLRKLESGFVIPDVSISDIHSCQKEMIVDQIDFCVAAEELGYDFVSTPEKDDAEYCRYEETVERDLLGPGRIAFSDVLGEQNLCPDRGQRDSNDEQQRERGSRKAHRRDSVGTQLAQPEKIDELLCHLYYILSEEGKRQKDQYTHQRPIYDVV